MTRTDEFKIGLALLNGCSATLPREVLIDKGDDMFSRMVDTHETFADFCRSHGSPASSRTTPAGLEIHEWARVQFRKGQTRGSLYLMEFEGAANGSMFRG